MYEIVSKETLAPQVTRFRIKAPEIAEKRKAGQFIVLRTWEHGERIPLTIADADPEEGTITLVSQSVGKTTNHLASLEVGQSLQDLVGPLGMPTHIENYGTVVGVGGGIGIAPLYPITQSLKAAGNHIISILGARTKDLLIMEEEMRPVSDETFVMTDDGSYGTKGLVTDAIKTIVERGTKVDLVVAIGPTIMMKFVSLLTKQFEIPTMVSLNTIMIDGTGMCGGCRVTVGGKTKFTCVDGPEFDGHLVDFDEMMQRLQTYKEQERYAMEMYEQSLSKA